MNKKLKMKDYLTVASMLFGMLFGAGNLIFPVFMGQNAGSNMWPAVLGFIVTAVGLSLMAIAAMALSESSGIVQFSSRAGKKFARSFTILLYLVIGPLFVLPRLATTSFEVAFSPYADPGEGRWLLLLFSIVFFGLSWQMARQPNKVMDIIGKYLNPPFLISLGILLVLALKDPMSSVSDVEPVGQFVTNPFLSGFLDGYNTLDAVASLAFGSIVITTIKKLGVTEPEEVAAATIKSGTISTVFMAFVYIALTWLGVMSVGGIARVANGGQALAQLSWHYLGRWGALLLAVMVTTACLKTSVGLVLACGETFHELFPRLSYQQHIALITILPTVFSNVGLTTIVQVSLPVFMFIYPLSIVLIFLTFIDRVWPLSDYVFRITVFFTGTAALFDVLASAPNVLQQRRWAQVLLGFSEKYLPLSELGFSWLVPALVGLALGLAFSVIQKRRSSGTQKM